MLHFAARVQKVVYRLLLLLYLLMLALNLFTPFSMDDYYYAFSCLTGERMTRLDQLIPSLSVPTRVITGAMRRTFSCSCSPCCQISFLIFATRRF